MFKGKRDRARWRARRLRELQAQAARTGFVVIDHPQRGLRLCRTHSQRKRIVHCAACRREAPHAGRGFCFRCYVRDRRRRLKLEAVERAQGAGLPVPYEYFRCSVSYAEVARALDNLWRAGERPRRPGRRQVLGQLSETKATEYDAYVAWFFPDEAHSK